MPSLGPGRIFWAIAPGKRGGGKRRPMIVVNRGFDINRDRRVVAVVCSTDFAEPLGPAEVLLPSDPDGRVRTRLRSPTVAVCDWKIAFDADAIIPDEGMVTSALLREIRDRAGLSYGPER